MAILDVEKDRISKEQVISFALLVLQQRTTSQVLHQAYDLLLDKAPAARQLGTLILREFPSINGTPHQHSVQTIKRLEQMVARETDVTVLCWGLSAIGWQCHPTGTPILLKFKAHEQAAVREVVAENLLKGHVEGEALSVDVATSLLEFIRDSATDIRWAVFWDIAEYPSTFHGWESQFRAAAQLGTMDPDNKVCVVAARALQALGELHA
jgi:hypothetical protein